MTPHCCWELLANSITLTAPNSTDLCSWLHTAVRWPATLWLQTSPGSIWSSATEPCRPPVHRPMRGRSLKQVYILWTCFRKDSWESVRQRGSKRTWSGRVCCFQDTFHKLHLIFYVESLIGEVCTHCRSEGIIFAVNQTLLARIDNCRAME